MDYTDMTQDELITELKKRDEELETLKRKTKKLLEEMSRLGNIMVPLQALLEGLKALEEE